MSFSTPPVVDRQTFYASQFAVATATNQGIDKAHSQFAPNLAAPAMQLPTLRPGEGAHIKATVVPSVAGQWLIGVLFTLE